MDRIDFAEAVNDLTLGELAEWEEHTGKSLAQMQQLGSRDLAVIYWLLRRRDNPAVTLDEVLATVRVRDLAPPDPGPFDATGNGETVSSVISPGP